MTSREHFPHVLFAEMFDANLILFEMKIIGPVYHEILKLMCDLCLITSTDSEKP